jgi:hypothetical protein
MPDFEMPAKPTKDNHWLLDLNFKLGFVANLDETGQVDNSVWIDLDNQTDYLKYIGPRKINHQGINFKICLDGSELVNLPAESLGHIQYNVLDTLAHKTRLLTFEISGYQSNHMPLIEENLSARAAIKLEFIKFENVNLNSLLSSRAMFKFNENDSAQGVNIFTCDGIFCWDFFTPIYHWLLENQQEIKIKDQI